MNIHNFSPRYSDPIFLHYPQKIISLLINGVKNRQRDKETSCKSVILPILTGPCIQLVLDWGKSIMSHLLKFLPGLLNQKRLFLILKPNIVLLHLIIKHPRPYKLIQIRDIYFHQSCMHEPFLSVNTAILVATQLVLLQWIPDPQYDFVIFRGGIIINQIITEIMSLYIGRRCNSAMLGIWNFIGRSIKTRITGFSFGMVFVCGIQVEPMMFQGCLFCEGPILWLNFLIRRPIPSRG